MKRVLILAIFPFSLLIISCGQLLMSYHEEPLCRKADGVGFCGSLSEIYEDSERHPEKYGIGGNMK